MVKREAKANKLKVFSAFWVLFCGVVGLGAKTGDVYADSNIEITAKVEESLSLSLSDSSKTITFTEVTGSGSFGSTSFSVRTSMNIPRRYQLSMYSSSSAADETSLKSTTSTIPTLTSAESNVNLATGAGWNSKNTWGFAIGTSGTGTFNTVGGSSSASILHNYADSSAATINMETTNITLGTMVDLNTSPGTYSTTLNFVVLAELVYGYDLVFDANGGTGGPDPIRVDNQVASSYNFTIPATTPTGGPSEFLGWSEDKNAVSASYVAGDTFTINAEQYVTLKRLYAIYNRCGSTPTMQSFDPTTISSMTTGEQVQMCDSRDGKLYWVSKLADGNVWMTQNLDLDLSTSIALTSADSDVTSSWTPQNNTKTASAGSWSSSYSSAYSYDPGDNYIPSGTGSATSAASLASNSTDLHYHQGNYYNWYAATAGSDASTMSDGDEATQSICPKGWRLPYGTQANKSWYYLVNQASITASNITTSPFYIPRAGLYFGSVGYVGSRGFYWSSTAHGDDFAYYLYFDSSSVYPQNGYGAYGGSSVRCVSR